MDDLTLIKIGGNQIDDPVFLTHFAQIIAERTTPTIIVHGGGKEITTMQHRLGIEPVKTNGIRVTDHDTLQVVEMVLCGSVNKRLVRYLVNAGVTALGLSGVDLGIVRAIPMKHETIDMQFTGQVTGVNVGLLLKLLALGITPVLAPISIGANSNFNVNADHVAGAIGTAVQAERVIFLTNMQGVLVEKVRIPSLLPQEAEVLIAEGTIFGGMIPKVQVALMTLEQGVSEVIITDLEGLATGKGTTFQN